MRVRYFLNIWFQPENGLNNRAKSQSQISVTTRGFARINSLTLVRLAKKTFNVERKFLSKFSQKIWV